LPNLLPQTILAVRDAGKSRWRMLALHCELADLSEQIAKLGLAASEKRFVGASYVAPDRWDSSIVAKALKRGWHQGAQGDAWFPVEEPLPLVAGSPVRADITLSLRSIISGCIDVTVEVDDESHLFHFDNTDDELTVFVRFVQVLASGGLPHAAFADYANSHFVVQAGPEPGLCCLHMKISQNDGQDHQRIDVLTERKRLVEQFSSLASAIADHPNLGHQFLFHGWLSGAEYDRVGNAAEAEWKRGVEEGRFPDDFDAEQEFTASKLVAEVMLSPEDAREAEQYRTMLRTLQIPCGWMVRFGLAPMQDEVFCAL
jgi:hypothetical protein